MLTLHPFVRKKLPDFDLLRALNYGLLPPIHFSDDPEQDLAAYTEMYLLEEIAAEELARSVPAFNRFLEVAALCNGMRLNYTNIANDAPQLVQPGPGRLVAAQAENALKTEGAGTILLDRNLPHRLKPSP